MKASARSTHRTARITTKKSNVVRGRDNHNNQLTAKFFKKYEKKNLDPFALLFSLSCDLSWEEHCPGDIQQMILEMLEKIGALD